MTSRINNNIKILTKQYYDTQLYIDQLNRKIQDLRGQKKNIESSLIMSLSSSGLQNQAITYQGKKIYIAQENNYDVLSFKFLEQCLLKLFNNNQTQVKNIIKFIKQERSKTTSNVIKMR